MNNEILKIRYELERLAEPKYQKFAASLIPGVDNLIGVRLPAIRKIAKRVVKGDWQSYLTNNTSVYFEEIMLQGMVIGLLNEDIEVVLEQVKKFVPKINNWSVCDTFCNGLKIIKEHKSYVWEFLKPYYESNDAYDIRFAVVTMLFFYIEEEYIEKMFSIFDSIHHSNYYVKMAVAWAISMCYVNLPEQTMSYLKNNHLDDDTYNKALQKIRESLKVDKRTKEIIKAMKR